MRMTNLLEYVGNVHIFLGPYRGNPIALYLTRSETSCRIAPKVYPWKDIVGQGETANRAAADFEEKWKANGLASDMYTGPHWEGGIKPEKPKPAAPAKPATPPAAAPPAKTSVPAGSPPNAPVAAESDSSEGQSS
jgi:hypothetical protein